MNQYELLIKLGEGTFSEVFKAQSIKTGNCVAIKCMKNHFNSIEQVQRLKEIQALRKVSPHPHIIKLIEVLYDEPTGRLALVFELMEQNLYEAIRGKKQYLNQQKVKYYMYQLLKAIDHMHKKGIFHRDVKPENILLLGDHIKLADLGSCKGIYSEHPYTEYISTRWYRAPECLLTDGYYSSKMDLWGVGSVLFEVMSLFPLFPGNDELDQIHKIHNVLGTPSPKILDEFRKHATHMELNFPPKKGTGIEKLAPHIPKDCIDLIQKLLRYDPEERITAEEALRHPFFRDLYSLDQENSSSSQKLSPSAMLTAKYNSTLQDGQIQGILGGGQTNSSSQLEYSPQYQGKSKSLPKKELALGGPYKRKIQYPKFFLQKPQGSNSQNNNSTNNNNSTSSNNPTSFNLNLKIEGNYKDSGTDEEQSKSLVSVKPINKTQFLPPIKAQQQHITSNSIIQMEAKINLYKTTKPYNNPKTLKPKNMKKFSDDYLIQGKKQHLSKQQQQ